MYKKILPVFVAVAGALAGVVNYARAAADADVTALATSIATTTKENVFAGIQAVLPIILVVAAAVVTIGVAWKLVRRFTGR